MIELKAGDKLEDRDPRSNDNGRPRIGVIEEVCGPRALVRWPSGKKTLINRERVHRVATKKTGYHLL